MTFEIREFDYFVFQLEMSLKYFSIDYWHRCVDLEEESIIALTVKSD